MASRSLPWPAGQCALAGRCPRQRRTATCSLAPPSPMWPGSQAATGMTCTANEEISAAWDALKVSL